jgi:hypothetical protein
VSGSLQDPPTHPDLSARIEQDESIFLASEPLNLFGGRRTTHQPAHGIEDDLEMLVILAFQVVDLPSLNNPA